MKTKLKSAPFYVLIFIVVSSCSLLFTGISTVFDALPEIDNLDIAQPTDQGEKEVFFLDNTIIVYQGFACAKSDRDGVERVLRLQGLRDDLPDFVNKAAVFASGWNLEYIDDDEHILGLGSGIANVKYEARSNSISWDAFGAIADDDFKDGYNWCYSYTVVAWNNQELAIDVDQNDIGNLLPTGIIKNGGKNVLRQMEFHADYLNDPTAILPRGFALGFENGGDEHLLQFGSEIDFEEDMTGPILEWNSNLIFRDNDTKQQFQATELVSALAGPDVNIMNQPFILEQWDDDDSGFTSTPQGSRTFTIEDIPYEIAIPILTGWNIHYPDDQHVREIGIQIEDFSYELVNEKDPGVLTYTLSSVLRDNDSSPKFFEDHKITLLVMKPLRDSGGPATITAPDDNVLINPATVVTLVSEVDAGPDLDKDRHQLHSPMSPP